MADVLRLREVELRLIAERDSAVGDRDRLRDALRQIMSGERAGAAERLTRCAMRRLAGAALRDSEAADSEVGTRC